MPVVAAQNKALLDFDCVIADRLTNDICIQSPGRVMSLSGTIGTGVSIDSGRQRLKPETECVSRSCRMYRRSNGAELRNFDSTGRKNVVRRVWSGRGDSNPRSPDPQSGAITRLRYVPNSSNLRRTLAARLGRARRSASCRRRLAARRLHPRRRHRPDPRRGWRPPGAARRNSSAPGALASSSRIDCSPRLTAVSRSRAFSPISSSIAGASTADRRCLFFELAPRAGQRQAFDQQQVLDLQHLLDVARAGRRAARRPSSPRPAAGTPPPTSAARTAAPWRDRTPRPP